MSACQLWLPDPNLILPWIDGSYTTPRDTTGRAYATVITAGSDGSGAQAQIDRIVTGWRLRRVAEPIIIDCAAQTPEAILAPKTLRADHLAHCSDLGRALAEGIALGIF